MNGSSLHQGMRIGSYELVRRIGRGGMAEVWCARRTSERRTSKFVAIKVVADAYVGDPRFQRMFRSEAALSALLNHVNIVQVFDEGEDAGRSFLVMEWIDGLNLLKLEAALALFEDEELKLQLIAYITGQLLHALSYAHSVTMLDGNPLGIVHRDVSPHNVLISNRGEVKLTDFGVAHHVLEESSGTHVKGKIRYMAPEHLAGRSRDPRVDLYAVGALLHEMLDGRLFRCHAEDQRELYIEVLSGRVPELWGPVPPELDALRQGLLEADPELRVPTADAALELLERYPGYGDARRALAQLCGGITGVVKPRVGMQASGAVPAAAESSRELPSQTLVVSPLPPGAPAAMVRGDTSPLPPVGSSMVGGAEGSTAPTGGLALTGGAATAWHGDAAGAPVMMGPSTPLATVVGSVISTPPHARASHAAAASAPAGWRLATGSLLFGLAMLAGAGIAVLVLGEEPEVSSTTEPTPGVAPRPAPVVVAAAPASKSQEREATSGTSGLAPDEDGGSSASTGAQGEVAIDEDQASSRTPTNDDEGNHASRTSGDASARPPAAGAGPGLGSSDAPPAAPPATGARERPPVKPRDTRVTLPVTVAAELGLLPLEVRLAGKTYSVTKLGALGRLPVGKYVVKWRRKGEAAWRDEVSVEVVPDCELNLKITAAAGLTPRPMGKGCK